MLVMLLKFGLKCGEIRLRMYDFYTFFLICFVFRFPLTLRIEYVRVCVSLIALIILLV